MGKSGHVIKTMLIPGNGRDKAHHGDVVSMTYTLSRYDAAAVENGCRGAQYDNSASRGHEYSVSVGLGRVIRGWDEAVLNVNGGMTLGEVAAFQIPSEYAYGKHGFPGLIPPFADLILDVRLTAINGKRA